MMDLDVLRTRVRERFPELTVGAVVGLAEVTVPAERLVEAMTSLRDDLGFEMLCDVTAVDWLPREPRYDVVYHLLSLTNEARLRVKVELAGEDEPRVASVTSVWAGADWLEREVFDFFGIVFNGHPNLRRILMPDEWIGHPLRKDYPVGGVPVEFRIEPAYVGENVVPDQARPSAGGVPARLRRDRGRKSHWTWTGAPASGVRPREQIAGHEMTEEGKEE
jgi:NADH-quinone oxidoreductase subunit C